MRLELLGTSITPRHLAEPNENQVTSDSFLTYLNNALKVLINYRKKPQKAPKNWPWVTKNICIIQF